MNVLLFGTFDPAYGRNRVLIRGLRANGIECVQCNGGTSGGVRKLFRLLQSYFSLHDRRFDTIIVAFPAQEVMLLAPVLFLFRRLWHKTAVVVDMLTSHYDGYILDRKKYSPRSVHAVWYRWLDRNAVRFADCAIVESDASAKFLVGTLGIPARKLLTVPIGTDDEVMRPGSGFPAADPKAFLVHFHGKFIPHQGIGTIVKAANVLRAEGVRFRIIGRGQQYREYREMADALGLSNIDWIDSVPYERLPDYINSSDVCLGPMGGTGHFDRCAPNKLYEYMACGKPIITGDSAALRGIANDGINMMLVAPEDELQLAKNILRLKTNKELREALGRRAREDFEERYTPRRITEQFMLRLGRRHLIRVDPGPDVRRICITGAAGFVGSQLTRHLTRRGFTVLPYVGDISDFRGIEESVRTAEYVIHLAAKIDDVSNKRASDDYVSANVLGTQRVIELCLKYDCTLIYFSSLAAVKPRTMYGLTKRIGEQLVQYAGIHSGLRAYIFRLGNVYNADGVDRRGRKITASRTGTYPMERLLRSIDDALDDTRRRRYIPVITLRVFVRDVILSWPMRIWRRVVNIQ